jgi:hypothetical protein
MLPEVRVRKRGNRICGVFNSLLFVHGHSYYSGRYRVLCRGVGLPSVLGFLNAIQEDVV